MIIRYIYKYKHTINKNICIKFYQKSRDFFMDKEQTSKQSFDKFIQNNKIQIDEEIYKNTTKEENLLIDQKPWRNDPYYFKKCKNISFSHI